MEYMDIFTPSNILLPKNTSMEKWSVVACDQYSSEHDYWEKVCDFVADAPSTFNMIIPEAFLEDFDEETEIKHVCANMADYLNSDLLETVSDSFVFVERTQADGRIRRGIVGAIDLEAYDFSCHEVPIRASEGTVLERLPPRIAVRRIAVLELPHIMTLIDDPDDTVIGALFQKREELPLLYDFELMQGGGHIRGMKVTGNDTNNVIAALNALGRGNDMLMAIGDGNHSLAAAKVYWDEIKQNLSDTQREKHPARRALVELNNVYDEAIDFEPIHRVLFNVDSEGLVKALQKKMPGGCDSDYAIEWISGDKHGTISIGAHCIGSMIDTVQNFLDEYTEGTQTRIDYIHGDAALKKLASQENSLGIMFPPMKKSDFFLTVKERGVFPRKSFSIGHAWDKRYYLECREIV